MFEDMKQRLTQGLALIRQGKEILDEVRENFGDARKALSLAEVQDLGEMLAEVSAESETLSGRIQRP